MPFHTSEAGSYDFDIEDGDATYTQDLLPMEFSRARELILVIAVTAVADASDDLLDVYLDETWDAGVTWNERAHSQQFDGGMTASASAPVVTQLVIPQIDDKQASEKAYEPGSLGVDTVRVGPFPRVDRTSGAKNPTMRLRLVVQDGDGDAAFTLSVKVLTVTEI